MEKENIQKEEFIKNCMRLFSECPGNRALLPGGEELTIYEEPLIGFASPSDELFERYKEPEVIGPHYMAPREWMPQANTVVSFFLPFTEAVRKSNRGKPAEPSVQWLFGRVEGQDFVDAYMETVRRWLEGQGIKACVPSADGRFAIHRDAVGSLERPDLHVQSHWSERHAAYACGLGTFGLSRGLITKKGMAGRLGSVLIDAALEPDRREYQGVYDYCTKCGACIKRCPIGAITMENGKNNAMCSDYVDATKERYSPRYGCGKCQTGVPCEHQIPKKQKEA